MECTGALGGCIKDIKTWMTTSMLMLNDGKTEFIVFGTSKQLENVTDITAQVGAEFIKPVKKVCNLGFFMDCLMKNGFNVNKINAQTFITLCNIKGIRRCLNRDITKTIIQALVMSNINYCNSLLDGSA